MRSDKEPEFPTNIEKRESAFVINFELLTRYAKAMYEDYANADYFAQIITAAQKYPNDMPDEVEIGFDTLILDMETYIQIAQMLDEYFAGSTLEEKERLVSESTFDEETRKQIRFVTEKMKELLTIIQNKELNDEDKEVVDETRRLVPLADIYLAI